tara:strand:- start:43 stop:786 length:744 start_codon:yes stop_codon:yes gene_type:complete
MAYFSQLPNTYIGEGLTDDENFKYRLVKNIFRRCKIRDDLEKYTTLFETTSIPDGIKPSDLALAVLGSTGLDWVILLVNNITDVYEQWPKSEFDLQNYCEEKYTDSDQVHHYETREIKYNDIIFIKRGIEVNSTFRAVLPDGTTKSTEESIYPVSNYEHESYLNDMKRLIRIPTGQLTNMITDEFANLVAYEPHSELDDQNNKKTVLNVAQRFIDTRGYISASVSNQVELGTVTSYDNGPGSSNIDV